MDVSAARTQTYRIYFSGAPTGFAQSCPGSPCGGFMPGAVFPGLAGFGVAITGAELIAGDPCAGAGFTAGEFICML